MELVKPHSCSKYKATNHCGFEGFKHSGLAVAGSQQVGPLWQRSGHQPYLRCFTKQLATAAMPAVAKMIDCCVGTECPQWNSFASLSSLGCNDRAAAS